MRCSKQPVSFDHVVGAGEQRCRDIEPERLRSFEVDHQLELSGLLDGKVCGARSIENATHIVACAPEQGWVIRSIGHQAADLHKLPCAKQRGDRIFVGEAYDQFSVAKCQRIRKYEQRVGVCDCIEPDLPKAIGQKKLFYKSSGKQFPNELLRLIGVMDAVNGE